MTHRLHCRGDAAQSLAMRCRALRPPFLARGGIDSRRGPPVSDTGLSPMIRTADLFLIVAALLLARPATAETPDYSHVLSSVTLSFDGGDTDRAVLVENDDGGADLYVYLALQPAAAAKPALVKKNAAWSGFMWGTRASLEVNDKGSLLVKSGNEGIGRNRWTQTLTVVLRDKQFIVAGFTRDEHDTLDLKAGGACDINFLTGKGKRNDKPISVKTPAPKLADWSDESPPQACKF